MDGNFPYWLYAMYEDINIFPISSLELSNAVFRLRIGPLVWQMGAKMPHLPSAVRVREYHIRAQVKSVNPYNKRISS